LTLVLWVEYLTGDEKRASCAWRQDVPTVGTPRTMVSSVTDHIHVGGFGRSRLREVPRPTPRLPLDRFGWPDGPAASL